MSRRKRKRDDLPQCPVQRAVVRQIVPLCDLFSREIAEAEPAARFVLASGDASSGAERVRNATRVFALGAVGTMCRDLDLPQSVMHGAGETGRTQISELMPLHRTTVTSAIDLFCALRADGGEFGRLASARYDLCLRDARREVAKAVRS